VIASYLGVAAPAEKVDAVAAAAAGAAAAKKEQAAAVANEVKAKPALAPAAVEGIRAKVAARWNQIGYSGYREWIRKVTPPDMR